MVPALLMAAGLVLDGGRQLRAPTQHRRGGGRGGACRHPAERAGALRQRAPRWARNRPGQRRAGGPGSNRPR